MWFDLRGWNVAKLVYTFEYDCGYDPPFPAIEIGVRNPERPQEEIRLTVLIDSGSDITLLPDDMLRLLNALYVDRARVRGLFGGSRSLKTYMVQVVVGPHTIHAVQVGAVFSNDEVVLGRNVLNQLDVTLRGLAGVVEVEA